MFGIQQVSLSHLDPTSSPYLHVSLFTLLENIKRHTIYFLKLINYKNIERNFNKESL